MNLLFNYVTRYKKALTLALVLAAISQIFSLLDPQIFRLIIDNYATQVHTMPGRDFILGVSGLLLASVGVALVSRIAKNFQDYYVNVIVQRVGTRLYSDSIEHSFSLPYAVFEDQRSGELLQKVQKARTDSENLITVAIGIVFLSTVGLVFVISYALYVHWLVGLIYLALIPIIGIITFITSSRVKAAQMAIIRESSDLAGSTTETIRNVELVKSLGLEEQETLRLNNVNEKILQLELKKVTLVRTLSFIQGTLVNASRSFLLLVMLWLIFKGELTLGEFFTLLFYSFAIFSPLYELGTVASRYQEAKASMERIRELLNMKPEPKPESPVTIDKLSSVEFDKVTFSYLGVDHPAIKDITLKLQAGGTIAFVGPSGSGKSTLLKLIVGLYRPQQGMLRINNTESSQIDYDAFRQRIGYVSQDTQLFAGTIRENLLFVNPKATDEDCLNALKTASALSIIERGDLGLDTRIGEGGIKLSGGEKQRLAIARAMLRKPELIIFDEATSSLDSITEQSITETIKEISAGKSFMSILVAHRLSTVAHADTIYVLEHGALVEQGSHDELLQKGGLYAALWRQQGSSN